MVCRFVYNGLNNIFYRNVLSLVCFAFSIGATFFYKYVGVLPWNICQGLSALMFYDIGRRIKDTGGFEKISIVIGGGLTLTWIVAIFCSSMSICSCHYGCYPLDVIGAVGATWVIWQLSKLLGKFDTKLIRAIAWFGMNSLAVLCLHLFDLETGILHKIQRWTIGGRYHNDYLHVILQIAIICGLIFMWQKLKEKYSIRKQNKVIADETNLR